MDTPKNLPCTIVDLLDSVRGGHWSEHLNCYLLASTRHVLLQVIGSPSTTRDVIPYAGNGVCGDSNGHRLSEARFNFSNYTGITTSSNGSIYISEGDTHTIRKIDGDQVSRFAGTGIRGSTDGPALDAQFYLPYSLTYSETTSTWFVADFGNHCIRAIQNGRVSTIVGSSFVGMIDRTPFIDAAFNGPIFITISPDDSFLLVSDLFNAVVRKVDLVNEFVSSIMARKDIQEFRNIRCHTLLPDGNVFISGEPQPKMMTPRHVNPYVASRNPDRPPSKVEQSTLATTSASSSFLSTALSKTSTPTPSSKSLDLEYLDPSHEEEDSKHQPSTIFADTSRAFSVVLRHQWANSHIWIMSSRKHREIAAAATSYTQRGFLIYDASTLSAWNTPPPRPPAVDLSPLLSPSCPSRLSTISITNSYHSTSFSLHSIVLEALSIDQSLIESLLSASTLPLKSLEFFISSLYHNPATSLPAVPKTLEFASNLWHSVYIASQLNMDCSLNFRFLKFSILPMLSPEDLCSLLHRVWMDGSRLKPLVDAILPLLRDQVHVISSKASEWESDTEGFSFILQSLAIPSTPSKLASATPFAPFWFATSSLTRGMRRLASEIDWTSPDSPRKEGFVRLCIINVEPVLDVHEQVIYGSWAFFRRMVASGLAESQSGVLELPDGFPAALLFSIVQSLYGSAKDHIESLLESAREFVVSRGAEFELTSNGPEEEAQAPFELLVYHCRH